jgi:flagellar motor protein MotB
VTDLKRHLRSLVIAFAVLALSAGAVMADRGSDLAPAAPPQGGAAGSPDQDGQGDQASEAPESEAPETEAPKPADTAAPDAGTTAPTAPTTHPDNHGKLVSEAAQATTPTGFANHGAYVRTIAKANHGHDPNKTAPTHPGTH